jgi:signal transduction histidine kinase
MIRFTRPLGASGPFLFAVGLAVATGFTFWLGLRATREWQLSTLDAADTRANEVAALLTVALERDMKGGQVSVLVPFNETLVNSPPYELADRFARGFARFPYLESFYVWTERGGADGTVVVFNRADRTPRWDTALPPEDPFPVTFRRDPAALAPAVHVVRAAADDRPRFVLRNLVVGEEQYQTVAQLMYEGEGSQARLSAAVGFLVDLDWVRQHYFSDFLRQIQGILGDSTLRIEIVDEAQRQVATVGQPGSGTPRHSRQFSLVFADQTLVSELPRAVRPEPWSARVAIGTEATLGAASRGSMRTLVLLAFGALTTLAGLWFTVRAARASAELAATQAEFVSAVSHEMKTPLSLIKLASDTIANRRYATPEAIDEYGRMMSIEAQHLTRLIDNTLCYARINDGATAYDFEATDLVELIQESVDRFRPRIAEAAMHVHLELPADPVFVSADHLMFVHVIDNLLNNAVTHAAAGRHITVQLSVEGGRAVLSVADRGPGIPPGDLPRVFEKFYRQKGTRQRGTGLGLAIVRRIVEDHHGRVDIASAVGTGTTVLVLLPTTDAHA